MKRFYRSVWVSDVHLCTRDCRSADFYRFLDSIRCDYLYLVGDIIDVWALRKRWYWPRQYNEVLHKLLKRSRKGAKIIYIPGNHDEFSRYFVGYRFGDVEVHAEAVHETADGRRLLVIHGDEFDAVVLYHKWLAHIGDWIYGYLITVNRIVNAIRRRIGMPYWSLSGAVKRRVGKAVTFVSNFEELLAREARQREVDGVVCGHIHAPGIRDVDGVRYCNTGDWIEHCTALVEREDGSLELLWWRQEAEAGAPRGEPVTAPVVVGVSS